MTAPLVRAVLAVIPAGAAPVEVVGTGRPADDLRLALAGRTGDGAPAVVVDTTGDPARIEDALRRVDDLGTVVLAGPPSAPTAGLDTYTDLHVRGLTLVGVAPTTPS